MQTTTHDTPPPPPFAVDTGLGADEHDVALEDEEQLLDLPFPNEGHERVLSRDTMPEGREHLGDYASLELYFRAQLEDQVSNACQWILDCLDWTAVQRRFEGKDSRLLCESGSVYRVGVEQ